MTVKPIEINNTVLFDPHNKELYGGKAISLCLLRKLFGSSLVPVAYVIPCAYCNTRPQLDLSIFNNYYPHYNWAVRSGAPISMPGLMETLLNVKPPDLQSAIEKVWDSWNTEHAKAYRKAQNIPDDMGTAVVIQLMVRDPIMSGVAFTSDPAKGLSKACFDPIIEYVDGLGDKLVGGTVTPNKLTKSSAFFDALSYYLQIIHKHYGPSDVEWCVNADEAIQFVQMRPIKFPSITETTIDESGKTLIGSGEAVGAPVQRACVIRVADAGLTLKPGEGVYVDQFRPEYYPLMIKASAILCGTGGATCHASIIARELNKPAISGVDMHFIDTLHGKPVLLNGATGKIYKHLGSVDQVNSTGTVAVVDDTRTPNIKLRDDVLKSGTPLHANLLLARFYKAILDHQEGRISEERRNCIAREIADVFSLYFFLACLGETRHFGGVDNNTRGFALLKRRFSSLLGQTIKGGLSRNDFINKITMPSSLKDAICIMRAVHTGFMKFTWPTSYGGTAWGSISAAVLKYLRGEYTPLMFVDVCFNLKHNGGAAFNKFSDWLTFHSGYLEMQLNNKQVGNIEQVIQHAAKALPNDIGSVYYKWGIAKVREYMDRESIFHEDTTNAKSAKTSKKAKDYEQTQLATAA